MGLRSQDAHAELVANGLLKTENALSADGCASGDLDPELKMRTCT